MKSEIFIACDYGNETITEYLIEHGTNINKSTLDW